MAIDYNDHVIETTGGIKLNSVLPPSSTNLLYNGGGNLNWGGTGFGGAVVVSDTGEAGTSFIKNIVVLSQASYDALTPNAQTIYFIT